MHTNLSGSKTADLKIGWRRILMFLAAVGLFIPAYPALTASAQTAESALPAATRGDNFADANNARQTEEQTHYRIGVGDLIDVRVFNKPQFSRENVRVDGRGMIRMPLIERNIQVACKTEAELAGELSALYLEYLRRPQVDVFIKEYNAPPSTVIGAVNAAGRFQLHRQVRLLELIAFAGGVNDHAGRTIQVVHNAEIGSCKERSAESLEDDAAKNIEYFDLAETLKNGNDANPYVRSGDIISVSEADQIYIVGNVVRPTTIALREEVTLTRAIAMAGGTLPDTKRDKIRIMRQAPGANNKTEIVVNLQAIDKRKAADPVLQPNDIVEIPTNDGKRLLKSFIGAFVPNVAQLPLRVVP